jgi:L-ascorbate metabolism protein UlaG (beta-lactamase superfamily)
MRVTQVRNATLIIDYARKKFLVDSMLGAKGTHPAFAGTPNSHLSNPLVGLPAPISEIIDVDAVIVTHTHLDHWDDTAKDSLPKGMPLFVQHEKDATAIQAAGFTDVRILSADTDFDGVALIKTPGQHGSDEAMQKIGARLGTVCGVVFRHPDEKTLYLAGDTVWNRYVEESLRKHAPDVIVLNCGDAQIIGLGSIIMGKQDVLEVYRAALGATIGAEGPCPRRAGPQLSADRARARAEQEHCGRHREAEPHFTSSATGGLRVAGSSRLG